MSDQRDDVGRTILQSYVVAGNPKILLAILNFHVSLKERFYCVQMLYYWCGHRAALFAPWTMAIHRPSLRASQFNTGNIAVPPKNGPPWWFSYWPSVDGKYRHEKTHRSFDTRYWYAPITTMESVFAFWHYFHSYKNETSCCCILLLDRLYRKGRSRIRLIFVEKSFSLAWMATD